MPLYTQYPLSPRKFWKKVCAYAFYLVAILLPLLAPLGIVLLVMFLVKAPMFALAIYAPVLSWCGGLYLLALLVYAAYVSIYIRSYRYDATSQYIRVKKGVVSSREIHVPFAKVQDVYVDQDILDRMFGLYDVHLSSVTPTSGFEAHVDGLTATHAAALKEVLLARVKECHTQASMQSETDMQVPGGASLEISSKTYPIAARWFLMRICGRLVVFGALVGLLQMILLYTYKYPAFWHGLEQIGVTPGAIWFWVLGVSAFVFALLFLRTLLWLWGYSFIFLPEYIQLKNGVIARSEKHLPYRVIQDVLVAQGVMERLFGLSTVLVQNAAGMGGSVYIPGQSQEKAQELCAHIRQRIQAVGPSKEL